MVSHNFPPAHTAGTEIYTAQLARRLADLGLEVHVFCADKDVGRPDLSVGERVFEGLPVTELVNNLCYDGFAETWDHPRIAALFGELLDRERPDVCHFQHLLYLSIGCVEEAARRGLPVVFTLHDYWLQCPRFGQRVHADHSICHTIDPARCGTCLASFKFRQTAFERLGGRVIAGIQRTTGVDLSAAAKRARERLGGREAEQAASAEPPPAELAARMETEVRLREAAIRERLLPQVDRFLAPSRFLRDRFVEWGVPPERIEYVRTGLDPQTFGAAGLERRARAPGAPLRVAFVGTLAPHKGPDLLLEAWGRLPAELRARARLELFGPSRHYAAFREALARRAREVGATLAGELEREDVPRRLCEIDLLVVPSVWYENAPLVIHEALATGTPLLVARIGGMAELVAEGRNGFLFAVGDAADLADKLGGLIREPERLDRLERDPAEFKSADDDARAVAALYRELTAG